MDQMAHTILRFDRFTLDVTRGCLQDSEQDISLRPKAFEVLRYLTENAGRLISKQELFDAVWPRVTVSDDSLVQCIRELREKLGDTDHRLIKTVPRRGYLLDASVSSDLAMPAVAAAKLQADVSEQTPRPARVRMPYVVSIVAALVIGTLGIATYWLSEWFGSDEQPVEASSSASAETVHAPVTFRDCPGCPEMIALPAGNFTMGSPADERGRSNVEGAPRAVTIRKPFALGRFEVTVGEFSAFVEETGMAVGNACRLIEKIDGDAVGWSEPKASFMQPSYDASAAHPAGCISWHDAQAYVAWLRRRTGKPYRLPTEAEWEYAARAATAKTFSFGDDETQLCTHARFADLNTPFAWRASCRSETATYGPRPVGSFSANAWGLFDIHGNVWEWVEDCWTPIAAEIPTDGSAFTRAGGCEVGVLRGGSWASGPTRLRSAARLPQRVGRRDENMGFRVALSLND
jgi:formylglycine-generating enzyme required for sulfatase activity